MTTRDIMDPAMPDINHGANSICGSDILIVPSQSKAK